MATMITNDCINCGACEPECPNNAISQGDPVYVIDPKLCTECVGFHDYEACAAVCPVDVCVTDPNNIESEEVLMARARAIHPEVSFPENFESRFRKGEGKAAAAPTTGAKPTAATAVGGVAPSAAAVNAPASAFAEADVNYIQLPEIDSWRSRKEFPLLRPSKALEISPTGPRSKPPTVAQPAVRRSSNGPREAIFNR